MKVLLALLLVLGLALPARARDLAMGASSGTSPAGDTALALAIGANGVGADLSGVVDPDQYHVGPGDQFVVWVWGPISRSILVTIGPEGSAFIPEIGTIAVSGRTLHETANLIRERVRRSLRGVEVEVHLTHLRSFRIYLAGDVVRSGPLLATGTSRVADVLADSMLAPGASRRNIAVVRLDGERIPVDLQRFQLTGEHGGDPWLREGDVVHVPYATEHLGVWGAVGRPGGYELGPQDSLSTLMRLAGGLLPAALPGEARLVRWRGGVSRESLSVDLGGPSPQPNVLLRDGDQLYVPSQPGFHESQQVTVLGRVVREGVFPIHVGVTRMTDVLAATGGFLEDADRSSLTLVRVIGNSTADPEFERLLRLSRGEMTMSEYESFRARLAARAAEVRVDWDAVEKARGSLDLLMQDGDVLRVERRTAAVRVDGQVRRPGLVPYVAGQPFQYYLQRAGGLTIRAAHTQIRLTRSTSGQSMLAREASAVSPGDQLWVPERPDVAAWQYIRDVLAVSAQLATVWLAVKK